MNGGNAKEASMNDTPETLHAGQERLARDLRAVVDDAEQLLKLAVKDAGQGYDEARTRLQKSLQTAKTQLVAAEQAVAERVASAGRATDDYVHRHPWESIGIGAGIGLLIGLLIGRK
jgi:ElaB/YqjD/DUF883 family membrane-anchored ribosome-binding protein